MTFYPVNLVGNAALSNPVTVAQGGTGLTSSPITVALGGTGATTAAAAIGDLGYNGLWLPGDQGSALAASGEPENATGTFLSIAGTVYLRKVLVRSAFTATNVLLITTTAGSGTSTGSFVGLYSSAGTLLSGSSDLVTPFTAAAGGQTCALTTPQALAAGTFVWVAVLANLSVTQPTFARPNVANTPSNAFLTAATFRTAINGTSVTALPSSITPGSNTQTNAAPIWVGLS
jgi:hypothetical protein